MEHDACTPCLHACLVMKKEQQFIVELEMARKRLTRILTSHVLHRGAPGLVIGPCIVKVDHIVIREVQYQLEVNRCRNKEDIVKGNFEWVCPMWAGRPRVGNGAMHSRN
ncbi:hypothetical protein DPMN_080462 [Dreissena polymorpha]|uniref:Uncharacterized protein n=1 Tax=Dreissena polymorpha TaxID=45954 RepID=A0A9D4BRX7_DREPO|nr:hypothetical protein DPMN_080462 [Dreissena polymorpha]